MKATYWGYLLIVLGIGIVAVMILIYSYTSTNESDYYLLKESTEAAMIDALEKRNILYLSENDATVTEEAEEKCILGGKIANVSFADDTALIEAYKLEEENDPIIYIGNQSDKNAAKVGEDIELNCDNKQYTITAKEQFHVMNKDKFVESFVRRFSETNNLGREYEINFYKINEDPPLAIVEVKTTTDKMIIEQDAVNIPIVNRITGIIEEKE